MKPPAPGFYWARTVCSLGILQTSRRPLMINERDLIKPSGYVHHSDNLEFAEATQVEIDHFFGK